jgi:predicted protein tyrosine phosphatase
MSHISIHDCGFDFSGGTEEVSSWKGLNVGIVEPDKVLILPRLYLGNAEAATDTSSNITHCLSVMEKNMRSICKRYEKKQLFIRLQDKPNAKLKDFFVSTYLWIKSKLQNPDNQLLIHCQMGLSRSVSVLIAYLMLDKRWRYTEAFEYVKEKRPSIKPNYGFVEQLELLDFLLFHSCSSIVFDFL